ncbi:MAG: choice-of-anchor J domain-containing protein, partial [Bacteroidota bacterium]|nr:choice-of-anchor J domain-containing protein [Bacteroidota bacterium]
MAYQAENPARAGLFFTASVSTPGAPNDVTANNARYMLEAVVSSPAVNDVAVGEIQGYGSMAVPAGNPFGLRAVVRNAGIGAVSGPVTVTLTISGANTFTQTQTVASLAIGASSVVSFTNISLPNVGANTVTVTVPNDDVNGNNSNAQAMTTSATRFSFIAPGVSPSSAYGPGTTARTAAFCDKFTVNATRDVTAVRAFIYNDPNLVPNATNGQRSTVVYGVVLNATTGAVIARSPDYTLTATDLGQLHTFNLSGSVPVGDFLAGIAIVVPAGLTAGVFPVAYQAETPARPGLFYTATLPSTTAPADVASFNARFMIEAETAVPGTCPAPTALNITSSTSTTATFSFPAATGAIGYQIVYGPTGFTPNGTSATTATFTGTTYTVTGLNPSTGYDFYIRTVCSATDQSGLTGPVRLTTPCTAPVVSTFPYTQNFDQLTAGQTAPCGITVLDSNNDGFTWQARATVDAALASGNVSRSAPNAMVYSYNNIGPTPTVGADDWFFTPALTLAAGQRYRVSFYYRTAGQGLSERLEVKYGPAATPAGQTTTIYTNNNITNVIYLNATNTSTVAVADIVATGTNFVGFHAISTANQGFLGIDDLTITSGPLATSEALKHAVSVFPNPSNTGHFNLEIHGANSPQLAVEVSNMLGQRVYSGTAKDNLRNTVDLSGLTSGIYTLKVRNGQEFTQQQISIVK